jgi:hypothetical protein
MKRPGTLTTILFITNAALILAASQWMGCASTGQQQSQPDQPGFLYATTWNGMSVSCGNQAYPSSEDIDGTVGHPLYVGSLLARAVGGWYCNYTVVSGELPPGLSFTDRYAINGIPTERGHWILHLRATAIRAGASQQYSFNDIDVVFRFHITGSGEVHQ